MTLNNDIFYPISLTLITFYPTDRPYSIIEAALYLQQLYYNNSRTSYNSISLLWKWKKHQVRKFFLELGITLVYNTSDRKKRNKKGYINRLNPDIDKIESKLRFIFINELNDIKDKSLSKPKPTSIYKAVDPSSLLDSSEENISNKRNQLILDLHKIGCTQALIGDIGFNMPEDDLSYLVEKVLDWKKTALKKNRDFIADGAVLYTIKQIKNGAVKAVKKVKKIIVNHNTQIADNRISLEQFIEIILVPAKKGESFVSFINEMKRKYPDIAESLKRSPLILEPSHHTPIQLESIYRNKYLPLIDKNESE